MRPSCVVVGKECRQPGSAFRAVAPDPPIGPLAQAGLDEPLSLAVGLRPVRPRKGVLDAQGQAGPGEQLRAIRRTVVGQQAFDLHAERRIVGHGSFEEGHSRVLAFVCIHLHESGPGMVVDRHMGKLPSCTFDAVAPVSGHAMAGAHDPAEFLGVHVQQFTRGIALVALDGQSGFERLEAGEPQSGKHPADRRHAAPHDGGNGSHRHACTAQLFDPLQECRIDRGSGPVGAGVAVKQAVLPGPPEAPEPLAGGTHADPGGRCSWRKSHHRNAFDKQFAPLEGGSGILMAVHPVGPSGSSEASKLQSPRSFRVNNLLKHHS